MNSNNIADDYLEFISCMPLEFIEGNNEFEFFKNFFRNYDRKPMITWINSRVNLPSMKSKRKSTELRETGNVHFKKKEYDEAFRAYSLSLCFAEPKSEEYSLAAANRSTVLFNMNDYKNCVKDIERSIQSGYPKDLKYKLYQRLISCYFELNMYDQVKATFEELQTYVSDESLDFPKNKKDIIVQLASSIIKKIPKTYNNTAPKILFNDNLNLPALSYGANEKFASASKAIELRYTNQKGRQVVANRDLKMGDVLFVEKAFVFVHNESTQTTLTDSRIEIKCYYCFKTCGSPVPCDFCDNIFCDEACRDSAWDQYHLWECPSTRVNFWPNDTSVLMALRTVIKGAYTNFKTIGGDISEICTFGNADNNYPYVYKLMLHFVDQKENGTLHRYALTVALVLTYLEEKTDFFTWLGGKYIGPNGPERNRNTLICLMGGYLLRHSLQMQCNAIEMETIYMDVYTKFDKNQLITDDMSYSHARAIFPSSSMMNHSCVSNIGYNFYDQYIIVKADRDITAGQEICFGYSCDYQNMKNKLERRATLLKEYYFICKCPACTQIDYDDNLNGLLCKKCKGNAIKLSTDMHKCIECSHTFNSTNHFRYWDKAERLINKYDINGDVASLLSAFELIKAVLFKYHKRIYEVNWKFCKYYKEKDFLKWWTYHCDVREYFKMINYGVMYGLQLRNAVCWFFELLNALLQRNLEIKIELLQILKEKIPQMIEEQEYYYKVHYCSDKINYEALRIEHKRLEELVKTHALQMLLKGIRI